MKVLAANPEATAYHFLLREFKLFRNFTFSENDLNCFINFFYDFAEGMGYKLVDKKQVKTNAKRKSKYSHNLAYRDIICSKSLKDRFF